ncbi:MAG: GNAT family N-acetyltransferase [Candidatus Eremiobacteraeota bacterium]|nr:GNAT family N-acetyltransferase [Candidatus Eremiobacteraeota bacterium]
MLATPRLQLRPHLPTDLEESYRLWSDPQTVRYIGGTPLTREEVWSRLLRNLGHWQVYSYGYFVVLHQDKFLGEVGIAEFKREGLELQPEAGWVLLPEAQGQGFAREAVQGMLDWFARPTSCIIHPDHQVSLKMAAQLGYVAQGVQSYKGRPTVVHHRP